MQIEVLISGAHKDRAAHAEHENCMHDSDMQSLTLKRHQSQVYTYRPSVRSMKTALAANALLQPHGVPASQRALPVWKSWQSVASCRAAIPASHRP